MNSQSEVIGLENPLMLYMGAIDFSEQHSTADIKESFVTEPSRRQTRCQKDQHYHSQHAQAAANPSHQDQKQQNSSAQTAAKSRSDATENAENSVAPTNAQNAASQDHKRKQQMGSVIVTYKVFPEDIVQNFDPLKKSIEECVPASSSVTGYGEEPIAFGLVALLVQVKFPEDMTGLVDEFEKKLETIKGVSQVQTMMVRRSSR